MIEKRIFFANLVAMLICFFLPLEARMPKILRSGSLKMSWEGGVLWPVVNDEVPSYVSVEMEDQWAISGVERLTWQWENSLQLVKKDNELPLSIENIQIENIKNTGTLFLGVTNNIDIGFGYSFGQKSLLDLSSAMFKPQLVIIARW